MRKTTFLLAAIAIVGVALTAAGQADAGEPIPSDDLVLIGLDDAYTFGETATASLRNDGDVPYDISYQPECKLTFEDETGRDFRAPENTHCDLVGENLIMPGQTVPVMTWSLYECTIPGFFCVDAEPVPSGDYTISGSFLSQDGALEASVSETVSVTGPAFTDDVTLTFEANGQPSTHGSAPVSIVITNGGQETYDVPADFGCRLIYEKPEAGHLFVPPFVAGSSGCGPDGPADLAPGGSLTVVPEWKLDECTEFDFNGGCTVATPLAPGVYRVSGSLLGTGPSFTAFEATYTIESPTPVPPATPTPTPSSTPDVLPPSGGAQGGASNAGAVAAALLGAVVLVSGAWLVGRVRRGE